MPCLLSNMPTFLKTLRIKYQLMLWFSLLFGVALTIAGWVIFSLVHNIIEKNVVNHLAASTKAIRTNITTAVDVSIRNHLRAIAEKNHDILIELHRKTVSGEFTMAQAKKHAEEILLSQTIGETGPLSPTSPPTGTTPRLSKQ